jgi:hypothetical protein
LEPEAIAAARTALSALSKEQVRPYLNAAKLAQSELFAQIAKMAVEQAAATGDFGYVERSLLLLRSSRFHNSVARWYTERLGVEFSVTKAGPKPKRSSTAPNPEALLRAHLERVGSPPRGKVESALRSASVKPSSRVAHKDDIDMLDHPSLLPGSFGAGKRR